jgi:hypothetical protein
MSIWSIFRPFGTFSPVLVHFTRFGVLYQEKSGNPAAADFPRFRWLSPNHRLIVDGFAGCSFSPK